MNIKEGKINVQFSILLMDLYYYNLFTKFENKWYHAKIITYGYYKQSGKGFNDVRMSFHLPIIPQGGWHLSYFGSLEFIQNKIKTTCHTELYNEINTDMSVIESRVKQTKDVYSRPINLIHVPIQKNEYLPLLYEVFLINFTIPHNIN
jgi:hypothetical protein